MERERRERVRDTESEIVRDTESERESERYRESERERDTLKRKRKTTVGKAPTKQSTASIQQSDKLSKSEGGGERMKRWGA